MNANELRIGNWVFSNGVEFKMKLEHFPLTMYREFNGIELTESWLLKFGFKETDEQGGIYELGKYKITDEMEFLLFDYGDWRIKVESVHKLQNLYFALTGEELTIK